jgi:hypothetical protein
MVYETIITDYAKKKRVSIDASRRLHSELEAFFIQVSKSDHPLFPTKNVDKVWHHFILNTKLYQQYCLTRFGKFIHHTPLKTPKGFADCSADCAAAPGGDDDYKG